MLIHEPEYQKLSPEEQWTILRRTIKVYAAHPHPQRAAALRAEFDKIREELKTKKE
jgi:hypothetical protein